MSKRTSKYIQDAMQIINDKVQTAGVVIINGSDEIILPEDMNCQHCGGSVPTCCSCDTICERCLNRGWYIVQQDGHLKKSPCPRCNR